MIKVQFFLERQSLQRVDLTTIEGENWKYDFVSDSLSEPLIPSLQTWMESYLHKDPIAFPIPLDLGGVTNFTQKVLSELQKIPFGKTFSYWEISYRMGGAGPRAVGVGCSMNPFPLVIPCHRVLKIDGSLGGFSMGLEIKKRLLKFENRL